MKLIIIALGVAVFNVLSCYALAKFNVSRQHTHRLLGLCVLIGVASIIPMVFMADMATAARYVLGTCIVLGGASINHLMDLRNQDAQNLINESLQP